MKTQQEIVLKAKAYAESIGNEDGTSAYDYVMGYNQCQEDMADERKMIMETLLKIRGCKDYGNNSSTLAKELINSLNKQD